MQIKLNSERMRNTLMPAPQRCLDEIEGLLPVLGAEKVRNLTKEINEANNRLTKQLQSVEEFCSYLEFLEDIQKRQDEVLATCYLLLTSQQSTCLNLSC